MFIKKAQRHCFSPLTSRQEYVILYSENQPQRKHLDAIRILKGIYSVYMLHADGTLECDAGSFSEASLSESDRIDREKFGTDMLLET